MPETNQEFSRPEAEKAVRVLNLFYNRTVSYSFDHPHVQEFIPKAYEAFRQLWERSGEVSIIFQEFGYFVGFVDIVYLPNNRRIADHLRRFGIESVSFSAPPTAAEFSAFLDACSLTHANPEAFMRYLRGRGVVNLGVNDVSLRTVKADELPAASARQERPSAPAGSDGGKDPFQELAMRAVLGRVTAEEMGANLSMLQLLEAPDAVPKALMAQSAAAPDQPQALQRSLASVLGLFQDSAGRADTPVEDILAGMYNMRGELLKAIKAQQSLAQRLPDGRDVEDAANDLFSQTTAKLILTEYQKSQRNYKKAAHILKRIVPERGNLQRILPLLREQFLSAGIPLLEYYHVLEELNILLGSDEAYQEMLRAGEGMGVGQDEILQELRRDPAQAAKLLVLASEVKRVSGDQTGESLIAALIRYVDNAAEALGSGPMVPEEVSKMTALLHQMENNLNTELDSRRVSDEMKAAGRQKLRLRFRNAMGSLKSRAVLSQMMNPAATQAEKIASLTTVCQDEDELDEIQEVVLSTAQRQGMADELARQLLERARQELASRRRKTLSRELPQGVYVKNVLDFFLKLEVSRARRYNVPFSVILLSFEGLPEGGAQDEDLAGLQNVLIGDARRHLRESDFVGCLSYNRFMVVLPMTTGKNAAKVAAKLREGLSRQVALPDGSKASVRPRCGLAAFDRQIADTVAKIHAAAQNDWQMAG